jgi:tetratricopeptide (TPR) repeat protein
LPRDLQSHLSPEELAYLVEETESASQAAGADPDRDQARAHADVCSVCGPRLRNHRSVQASLRRMVSPVVSERKSGCPAEEKWTTLAAGLCSTAESRPLLEHASQCDHCGQLLRAATEDLNPEISPEEQELIRQLPSARPGWQQDLARKMADATAAQESANRAVSVREKDPSVTDRETHLSARSSGRSWPFANWTLWAAPVAAAAVVAVGAAIWIERSSPSLSSTNQLIAQAYTEQRPIELRFPGAGYGPIRQQRGESGPSRSRMDDPPPLLEAEAQIARGLARHPKDSGWLQAQARTDLFQGNYQSAIEALRQAEGVRPEDASIKIDLATAYFERAGNKHEPAEQAADYDLALQSLNNVLSTNPNNLVALFNRAVVYERLKMFPEASADWQRYLQIDPSAEWTGEAKRHVDEMRR